MSKAAASTFLLLIFLSATSAFASNSSCAKFGNSDEAHFQCEKLAISYNLSNFLIRTCSAFSKDDELNYECLRTGANEESVRACELLKMGPDNTLSCFRYGPEMANAEGCAKYVESEDGRMACIRYGREPAEVAKCKEHYKEESARIDCLSNTYATEKTDTKVAPKENRTPASLLLREK